MEGVKSSANKKSRLKRDLVESNLRNHKTAIQNRTVLKLVIGITPVFELLHFIRYQHFDSFPQLFFKESGVKTHPSEYLFDIIEHLHFKKFGFELQPSAAIQR
jgi:hypothetical protein